jgi:DNA-nicking Smr family endonuclease
MARRKKGTDARRPGALGTVKRTATPLAARKPVEAGRDPASAATRKTGETPTPGPSRPFRIGEAASAPSAPQPRHDLSDRIAQAPIRMKQTAHRRMIRGKMKPEARIDLHGMTLSEAHPALVDFVIVAHARACAFACHHRQGARRRPRGSRSDPDPSRRSETAGSRLADGAAAGTARPRNPRGASAARRRRGVLRLSQAAPLGSAVTARNG